MAKSSRYISRRKQSRIQEQSLRFDLVSSATFSKTQIVFIDNFKDTYKDNEPIATTPTFGFVDPSASDSKVMIDYSHSANPEDLQKLKSMFSKMMRGTQFTYTNGEWLSDQDTDYKTADLSGTYEFLSYENNVITAKAVSVTTLDSRYSTYKAENFTEVPQITVTIATGGENISQIKNILGASSAKSFYKDLNLTKKQIQFNKMWIEIVGSKNNTGKIELLRYDSNDEGAEILIAKDQISSEKFSEDGTIIINVYMKSGEVLPTNNSISETENVGTIRTSQINSPEDLQLMQDIVKHTAVTERIRRNDLLVKRIDGTTEKSYRITVKKVNNKNIFLVDGERIETLSLEAGKYYRFIQDEPSSVGHPFKISRTNDGVHKKGTNYYTGSSYGYPGTTYVYSIFIDPSLSNKTLYSYCLNHPGMGFAISISGTRQTTTPSTPQSTPQRSLTSPRTRTSSRTTSTRTASTTTRTSTTRTATTTPSSTRTTTTTTRSTSSGGGGGGGGYGGY